MATTTKHALSYPVGSDPSDVPKWIKALATDLDPKIAVYEESTFATRPAVGKDGRVHISTDVPAGKDGEQVSLENGSKWFDLTYAPVPYSKLQVVPACRVGLSGNVTLNYQSVQAVAWNAEAYDTDGMHDNASNNSRITFKTAGIYTYTGTAIGAFGVGTGGWSQTTSDFFNVAVRLNGTSYLDGGNGFAYVQPGGNVVASVAGQYKFSVNDYIELHVYSDTASGGTSLLTPSLGMYVSNFAAVMQGRAV